MQRWCVLLAFLLECQAGFQVISRKIHVTYKGHDISSCGRSNQPCQTVRFAVRKSRPGDTILVEYAPDRPYEECRINTAILIQRSLTIRGVNGTAEIQCREDRILFSVQKRTTTLSLNLVNLILSNSKVAVNNFQTSINLVITECIFRNNSVGISVNRSRKCFLVLNNSSFHNQQSAGIDSLHCQSSIFSITNTSFYSSTILQREQFKEKKQLSQKYELFVTNCSFLGENVARQRVGTGIFIHSFAEITRIDISNTIFKNLLEVDYNKHIIRLKGEYNPLRKSTFIKLDRLTFKNNYCKKTLIYVEAARTKEFSVSLGNSLFENNTGTIEFAISPFKAVSNNNGQDNAILLRNNIFLRNHYFPNEGLAGIYATLFFNLGSFQVVACKFIDNHHGQSPSTGVISISDFANVTLQDCYFEHTQVDGTAVQVFAYPNSFVTIIGNNTFNIIRLDHPRTIFIHLPCNNLARSRLSHCGGVVMAGILKFVCPQGFNTRQQDVIKWNRQAQNKTTIFSYLNILCWPCPRKTYSLVRGMVTYFPNNTRTFANNTPGTKKGPSSRDIECYECPRGGHCVLGQLKAKANFWGYEQRNKVRFIDCPKNYCCKSPQCPFYDTCHGQRTGTLCGRCPNGTSEALFSTACRQNSTCNATIFFPAVAILLLAYIIFFLYQEDIACFLQKGLSLLLPQRLERVDTGESGGCDKIIFYYYQTINLLVSSVGFEEKQEGTDRVDDLISDVFNLVVADVSSFDCPLPSITPVSKTLISHSLGFALLLTLAVGCLIWKVCSTVRGRKRRGENGSSSSLNLPVENDMRFPFNECISDLNESNVSNDVEDSRKPSFSERSLCAFTHISLLMYSATARLCLTLLHCVPYKHTKVLFIDGTMQCYQSFQYALLGYVIMSVLPFCMVPFLGSYVLKLRLISVAQFCLGCLLPFPFCCFWLGLLLRNRDVNRYERDGNNSVNKNRLAILHILSGPFRNHEAFACFPRSPLAWEGVLILRRLVLILIFAFTYDSRWRTLYALTACVLILVIHLYMQPFKKKWENCLETASLATLVIFCGLTLVKALYRGEDYSSLYTNSSFMNSLNMVESILIIFPLAVIVVGALTSLISTLLLLLTLCFRGIYRQS